MAELFNHAGSSYAVDIPFEDWYLRYSNFPVLLPEGSYLKAVVWDVLKYPPTPQVFEKHRTPELYSRVLTAHRI
jgi:hypothetical protein